MLEFAINIVEEFKKAVKKIRGTCTEHCRRVLVTYKRCQVVVGQILEALLEHEIFTKMIRSRYQEDEQNIQQAKDLDEKILKYVVAHVAFNIHLLEDQLRLSPAKIEVVKNQAAKYEINIHFLEPSEFESIAAEAQAWKNLFNDKAGPSS